MTPYADFLYFGILLYIALPTLLVRRWLGFSRKWVLLATAMMLIVQYGTIAHLLPVTTAEGGLATGGSSMSGNLAEIRTIWVVMACGVFQWIVAQAFLWMRTRTSWYWPFPVAVVLTMLALVGARFLPLAVPGAQLGFLGISYVTFRSLDVIFGIRDRLIVSLPAAEYFAFLFFFPAISSGPIDRYRRFSRDWNRPRLAAEFWKDLDGAVHRIFTGFLYKFLLAASIKTHWIDGLGLAGCGTPCHTCTATVSTCTSISRATVRSPSGSATCWGSTHPRTSTAPFWPATSRTSGTAGTSAFRLGSAIMCT